MAEDVKKEQKVKEFDGYIVDDAMMNIAQDNAIFLHCLPAYRGYEVSEEVFEGTQSRIFEEAENRLHAQKAIMVRVSGL